MSRSFVHLHNHSDYSLLDGAIPVSKLVQAAKIHEQPAVALTDHGNLFGVVNFYREAKKAGVKPIVGMEAYTTPGSRHDRGGDTAIRGRRIHHLILLAENFEGYCNLIKLSSVAFLEGFYYKPRLDKEILRQYSKGIIALTACMSGEVNRHLVDGHFEEAKKVALELDDIFGRGNFFLEMQNHGIPEEVRVREGALRIASETGIPLVATNDCHYQRQGDHEAHQALMAINTGRDLDSENEWSVGMDQLYFKSSEEMAELFAEHPEALDNSLRIAERCNLEIPLGENQMPDFPLPEGWSEEGAYLEDLSRRGLVERYGEPNEEQIERLNYELGIIKEMGFEGYFLITHDFIEASKERGIAVGPGRGSAAGSLVCYTLGITDIDPLKYGLIFERFLNPERISMPDIDIDFDYVRRGEIIDYVTEKYGRDNVTQIITYGTMKARAVLRDVGRVLGMAFGEVDRIAKLVPEDLGITLEKAISANPEFAAVRGESDMHEKLIRYSLTLEGLTRHASTHAAGVLITPHPLVEHVPLYKNNKDEITTQWDMVTCEQVGLLKMDFLGLRTLTVIEEALRMLNANRGEDEQIKAGDIPMDDPATYELLRRGDTVGLFQVESGGMRDILTRLQPTVFEEIVATNALFRPGPLGSGMHDDFIDRKHGRKRIRYLHPDLEPILQETYGTIVYQEQVMEIASVYGGYSMGEADVLRKAMGKKIPELLADLKNSFVEGAVKKGHDERQAEELFDLLEYFSGYGFNKSHSAAYAMLSVQTAWLKTHHPAEYLAACMSSEMGVTDRIVVFMHECRKMGIEVVPPDVAVSFRDFRVADGRIFFGLGAVKNVGEGAIEEITLAREREGSFRDLHEFCEAVDLRRVNKRVLESLIMAGAMDALGPNRPSMLAAVESAMRSAQGRQRDKEAGQMNLLDGLKESDPASAAPVIEQIPDWERSQCLAHEKEVLGFFVSGHPLDEVRPVIEAMKVVDTIKMKSIPDDGMARSIGLISHIQTKMDRKGKLMAFLTVEDFLGSYEVLVFSSSYAELRELIQTDAILAFEGKISQPADEGDPKMILSKAITLEEALTEWPRSLHMSLPEDFDQAELAPMQEELSRHGGQREVLFHVNSPEGKVTIRARGLRIQPGPWLRDFLAEHDGRVKFKLEAGLDGQMAPATPKWRRAGAEA